jgi:hypothetical protein
MRILCINDLAMTLEDQRIWINLRGGITGLYPGFETAAERSAFNDSYLMQSLERNKADQATWRRKIQTLGFHP